MLPYAMLPSPLFSEIVTVLALVVLSSAVLLALRHFLPLRTTPEFYLVPLFCALFLPLATVLLVPIDLASSSTTEYADNIPDHHIANNNNTNTNTADPTHSVLASRGIWLPERVLLVSWRVTYWLTFALTWFILPILAEYADSGYREPWAKFRYSLRQNALFHAIVLGASVLGLLYIVATYGFYYVALKTTIMALAYCWGLALAIYLMGHGLVSIPRQLFRKANLADRVRRLQLHAPRVHEKLRDSLLTLDDVENHVRELCSRRTSPAHRRFHDWMDELADMIGARKHHYPDDTINDPHNSRNAHLVALSIPDVLTEAYLADLTRQVMRAQQAHLRYLGEWQYMVASYADLKAMMNARSTGRLAEFPSEVTSVERLSRRISSLYATPSAGSLWLRYWPKSLRLPPRLRFLWHVRAMPIVRYSLGALLSVASACIVWSEVVKDVLPQLSIIRITVVHNYQDHRLSSFLPDKEAFSLDWEHASSSSSGPSVSPSQDGQVGFAGQVVSTFWILYMCIAALSSLTELRVWRGRALVRRHTTPESALWYAQQVAKLSVPLSYNFVTFLSPSVYKRTQFYAFLGQWVDLTPLGRGLEILLTLFVLVPVSATLFGVYGRVRRFFQWADYDDVAAQDDADDHRGGPSSNIRWLDGRDLLERELMAAASDTTTASAEAGAGAAAAAPSHVTLHRLPHYSDEEEAHDPERTPSPWRNANTNAWTSTQTDNPWAPSSRSWPTELPTGAVDSLVTRVENSNFFGLLGHRIQNTLQTWEAPAWLRASDDNPESPSNSTSWFGRRGIQL